MSSLGIPSNLLSSCSETPGTINLSWGDTPPTCNPSFTCSSGNCDEILKSSGKQWTLTNALGSVVWSIVGTGASIDQSGNVTTTGAACGTLTITATDSCCGVFTQQVRVTNGGVWVNVYYCATGTGACCYGCSADSGCTTGYVAQGKYRFKNSRGNVLKVCDTPTCPACTTAGQVAVQNCENIYSGYGGPLCSITPPAPYCLNGTYCGYTIEVRVDEWRCP